MVRGKKKAILSYSERQTLEDGKREAEGLLRTAQEPGLARSVDQGAVQREIAHLDKELHDGRAPRMTTVKKDGAHREMKDLEGALKEGMPTRAEMDHPARHPNAVHKHMSWDKRNRENIKRYKELARSLEPDAPANYESLRRDK